MAKDLYATPASRWRALQTRDPLSATSFIYAVKSTGIYCRPTCPARLARRANILFFDLPSQASTAGFRPCRRCSPEDAQAPSTRGRHEELVWRACAEMEARKGDVNLRSLAKGVGLSPRYFHGVFKRVVGVTPGVYANGLRAGVEEKEKEAKGWEVGKGWLMTEEDMLRALASLDGITDDGLRDGNAMALTLPTMDACEDEYQGLSSGTPSTGWNTENISSGDGYD